MHDTIFFSAMISIAINKAYLKPKRRDRNENNPKWDSRINYNNYEIIGMSQHDKTSWNWIKSIIYYYGDRERERDNAQ